MADESELSGLDTVALLDAEAARLDRHLSGLDEAGWSRPSRCAGWRTREVVAHLCSGEDYNRASLDDAIPALMAGAAEAGVKDLDGYNAWGVRSRAERSAADVLEEWRRSSTDTRRRLRELGPDTMISTMVGPYPVRLQAAHLAAELAVHADDIGVPVDAAEAPSRLAWRARVARFGIAESDRGVALEHADGVNRIQHGGEEATLGDADLVEAVVARLPDEHPLTPGLRTALRVFA